LFFFFQAEDGIRAFHVTGVQTCALPISTTRPAEFVRLSASLLRPHLARQLEILALMVLGLVFTMAFPFITREIFDEVVLTGDFRFGRASCRESGKISVVGGESKEKRSNG